MFRNIRCSAPEYITICVSRIVLASTIARGNRSDESENAKFGPTIMRPMENVLCATYASPPSMHQRLVLTVFENVL